jgi:hypothetical protein
MVRPTRLRLCKTVKGPGLHPLKQYQIKVYLSRALNTTGVDLTVKCLLTGSNQ